MIDPPPPPTLTVGRVEFGPTLTPPPTLPLVPSGFDVWPSSSPPNSIRVEPGPGGTAVVLASVPDTGSALPKFCRDCAHFKDWSGINESRCTRAAVPTGHDLVTGLLTWARPLAPDKERYGSGPRDCGQKAQYFEPRP